jgi:hypothetical protein
MKLSLKNIFTITRWFFGVTFVIASIDGLMRGDIIPALVCLIIGLLLIPPIGKRIFGKKENTASGGGSSWVTSFSKLGLSISRLFNGIGKISNQIDFTGKTDIIQSIDSVVKSQPKPLSDKKKKLLGKTVYLETLEKVIEDLEITDTEKETLQKIETYFNLTQHDTAKLKATLNERAVAKFVTKQYEDKILTDEEKQAIVEFANYLGLAASAVEKIRMNVAWSLFKAAMNEKLKDKQLSPREETELNQTLRDLQIDEKTIKALMPQKSVKDLAFAKLVWQLENGVFPVIPNPITIKKYEECYLVFNASLWEQKTVRQGYKSVSQGFSIPVAKGVRYRVGSGRSVPANQEVLVKHLGNLFLTSYRIVFSGGKHSFQIGFNKLLTFHVYSNGIEFVIDGWTYMVEFASQDIELFATGLTSAIRNYMDEENDTKAQAMKEIENSEIFINISHQGRK